MRNVLKSVDLNYAKRGSKTDLSNPPDQLNAIQEFFSVSTGSIRRNPKLVLHFANGEQVTLQKANDGIILRR